MAFASAQLPGTDVTPPTITCHGNKTIWCVDPAGTAVFFDPPMVTDAGDPNVIALCQPETGSHFPIGTTTVTCMAQDASGNQSRCTFQVTVKVPDLDIDMKGGRLVLENDSSWPVETTTDLTTGNWDPLFDPPAPKPGASQFFRVRDPKQNPGIAFDSFEANISYVATGLMQDWYRNGETNGAHIGQLRWAQDDYNTAGGTVVLNAPPAQTDFTSKWSAVLNLPFKFTFYGKPFDRCLVAWDGLLTFDTSKADTAVNDLPQTILDSQGNFVEQVTAPLPNPRLPDYTICGFYTFNLYKDLPEQEPVRAYILGSKPQRQVWFVYPGAKRFFTIPNGISSSILRRAIVLEEGTNKIFAADMFDQNHARDANGKVVLNNLSHRYVIGIQKDRNTALAIPASPKAALNNESTSYKDNDYYDFTPRHLGSLVQGSGHGSLAPFDSRVIAYAVQQNWPGATVAAAKGGKLVYNKGFGHARVTPPIPMLPTHRVCIGSTSKIFTTTALFRLMEESVLTTADLEKNVYADSGLLGITAVTEGFTDGIANGFQTEESIARLGTVKLRHMLTHTAMLRGSGDSVGAALALGIDYDDLTYENSMRHFFGWRPLITTQAPGLVYSYSNQSLGQVGHLVGLLAQGKYGQSYETYMQNHVLKPIGVKSMRGRAEWIADEQPLDAFRYDTYTSGSVLPHSDSLITGYNGPSQYEQTWNVSNAAGGWTGTASDLVRLMCAQDGLPNRPDLLSAALRQIMHSRPVGNTVVDTNGNPMAAPAHGWAYDPARELLQHNGDIGYGSSYMVLTPNDGVIDGVLNWNANSMAIAVCLNVSDPTRATFVGTELRDSLANAVIPNWYDLFGAQVN